MLYRAEPTYTVGSPSSIQPPACHPSYPSTSPPQSPWSPITPTDDGVLLASRRWRLRHHLSKPRSCISTVHQDRDPAVSSIFSCVIPCPTSAGGGTRPASSIPSSPTDDAVPVATPLHLSRKEVRIHEPAQS